MPKGIGRQLNIGFAKEASRGVAESSATFWVPFNDLNVQEKVNMAVENQSYGVIEDSVNEVVAKRWMEGEVKALIGDKHFPLLLTSLLGTVNTSDNPDSNVAVKDHAITVGQTAQHPSLTTFLDDPLGAVDYKHANTMIEELTIKFELGKILEYSIKIKGKKGASATLTPSIVAENNFMPKHVAFKLATNLAGLDAASAVSIKSMTLKISSKLHDDDVLGSDEPADFLNTALSVEGDIEAVWQNETDFKQAALAGTAKAMRIDLNNSDVTIGAAAHPQITIDLAKVIFTGLTKAVKIDDVVMQTLGFKGHYSTGDAKMLTIKATNTQASY